MTVGEIKELAKSHGFTIEHVWELAASRFSFSQHYTILKAKDRNNIPVWGEDLEDLYNNVKDELTRI